MKDRQKFSLKIETPWASHSFAFVYDTFRHEQYSEELLLREFSKYEKQTKTENYEHKSIKNKFEIDEITDRDGHSEVIVEYSDWPGEKAILFLRAISKTRNDEYSMDTEVCQSFALTPRQVLALRDFLNSLNIAELEDEPNRTDI